jgi:L-fucose mutarotase
MHRLKNIKSLVSPELLYALANAAQGDTIVLAANDFPSARMAKDEKCKLIRADGLGIPILLKEIMKLITVEKR